MLNSLFPDDYISSIYDVDFQILFDEGYRVVLFDVDNTLVPHNAPADDRSKNFFTYLKNTGFKTALISNNAEPRVKLFCEDVCADGYQFKANKPSAKSYISAIDTFGFSKSQAIFVGDQIFTDILGAKNAGIRTIMVAPILKWKEEIQIILKRFLEAIVLVFYKKYVRKHGAAKPVPFK